MESQRTNNLPANNQNKQCHLIIMILIAVAIGIIAGLGAVAFRYLIGFIHNLTFLGIFDLNYDANSHTPAGPWGVGIILVPVVGAIFVSWLVKNFAPEAKGHGVPEVMESIYLKDAKIKPSVALIKSLASAISIGTGGSVGREGPIVQIGSTFGSVLGTIINTSVSQRAILVAAGAAAGIAATFNTPIGAIAFGIELMLVGISAYSLFILSIATVIATYIGQVFLGLIPSFYLPTLSTASFELILQTELALFVLLGITTGLLSILFIRGLYFAEDTFEKIPGNYYTRHMLGMFFMGVLMYVLISRTGQYYVQGVGYATITDILNSVLSDPKFLLNLVLLKLLATFLTLGSGGSGGIFSPALVIGACAGAALGVTVNDIFPSLNINPVVFAIAGMAGMIGGTTGAFLTAIVMVGEMTHDMNINLPIIITVATAYFVRKTLSNESVYTLKLSRRDEVAPEGLQSGTSLTEKISNVMNKNFRIIKQSEIINKTFDDYSDLDIIIVSDNNNYITGIVDKRLIPESQRHSLVIDQLINTNFCLVKASDKFTSIVSSIQSSNSDFAVVFLNERTQINNIVGIISKGDVFEAFANSSKLIY